MSEMRATREALGEHDPPEWYATDVAAALAEVAAMELVAEAARAYRKRNQEMKGAVLTEGDMLLLAQAEENLDAALAVLDGQEPA